MQGVRSFVLVTLGLVTLALSHHSGNFKAPSFKAQKLKDLRCQEVAKVAKWSTTHSSLAKFKKLESPRTTEKALSIFTEKVDPYRILFTASEIEEFKKTASHEWQSFLEGRSCGYFEAWLNASLPQARERLMKTVKSFSLKASGKGKEISLQKSKQWALNEIELNRRLKKFADQIVNSTPKAAITAYHGNLNALAISFLEENVLSTSLSSTTLLAKALVGTFDPYSTYLSSTEFEDFYSDLSGGASGIGIRVRKVPSGLLVEDIISDSSASQSGKLAKNDIITKVDGVKTSSLSLNEVKDALKGPEESEVKLEVQKETGEATTFPLKRKRFEYEESKITSKVKNSVATITIPNFYGNVGFDSKGKQTNGSAEDLKKVLLDLTSAPKKPEAMVLDLRGNPGGFLEEAVTAASFFVGSKPIVGVVENTQTRVLKEEFQEPLYDGKLVVLVDSGTASAAEVLAGALRDLQRAVVVGSERTYGKGSVQKLFSLDEEMLEIGLSQKSGNGVLKLTTSIFYSPLGHSPANGGVKSDIVLPNQILEPKEDYGMAPSMEVKEEKPFLDSALLTELQLKEEMHKGLIRSLQEMSASRLNSDRSESSGEAALAEASEVAKDLVKNQAPAL